MKIGAVNPSIDFKYLAKNYEYVEKIKKNISKPYTFTSKSSYIPVLKKKKKMIISSLCEG